MMEYLELMLGRSTDPGDKERLQIIRAMRLGRGTDISFPGTIGELVAENEKLREMVSFYERQAIEQRREIIAKGEGYVNPSNSPQDNFGRELKLTRTVLGLTQVQFAEIVPIDQSLVSKWERGLQLPTKNLLTRVCSAHNLQPDQQTRLFLLAGFPKTS